VRTARTRAVQIRQLHSSQREHRQRTPASEGAEALQAHTGMVRLTGLFHYRSEHREIHAQFLCLRQFSGIVTGCPAPFNLRPPFCGHQCLRGQVQAMRTGVPGKFFVAVDKHNASQGAHAPRSFCGEPLTRQALKPGTVFADPYGHMLVLAKWLPQHVTAILKFRRQATGRARDFNWHNVIGFWCAPLLIVLTATGAVMSYPWANRALYQLASSPLPAARGSQGPRDRQGAQDSQAPRVDVDRLWARAERQLPTWQTVTMRLPERPRAPVSFTMNDASHWNAFARSQLALDAATGDIVRWEPYAEQSRGQQWRGWVRFGHTGELGGVAGQALAGTACLGGVVLVWTGLALAWRRLVGWRLGIPARVASPPAAAPMPE